MMKEILKRLQDLLDYLNSSATSHSLLPDVVDRVEKMIDLVDNKEVDLVHLNSLALGLGMYISYDFEFSESETGARVLEVVNLIARYVKSQR